jgi:hypothetical protein
LNWSIDCVGCGLGMSMCCIVAEPRPSAGRHRAVVFVGDVSFVRAGGVFDLCETEA